MPNKKYMDVITENMSACGVNEDVDRENKKG